MKKILLLAGHSRRAFKWGLVGEVAKRIMEDSELYYLDCNNVPKGYCGTQHKIHPFYCNKCRNNCLKVVKHAGINEENILKMKKFDVPKFPLFKDTDEALDYGIDGYDLGLGAISTIMTITRDFKFDTKKWKRVIDKFFNTEYQVIKNLEILQDKYHFDEIHLFNGRMPYVYAPISFCKKHDIPYVVYESASNNNRIFILRNGVFHDFETWKQAVKDVWNREDDKKEELASKWYTERRQGVIQLADFSFTGDQKPNLLPKNFDKTKENIVFFNSSIDEVYAFKNWNHPFEETENVVIDKMLEHYKDDETKHFYLRVHPNLTRAKNKNSTQIREINELKKKYKNLTVLEPDEKFDTYALIEAATKVITGYSTIGAEATFWGAVSILAGKAPYEDLDCAYKVNSMEELYKLIDDKTLKPKPKENSYPYGYFFHEFGEDNKYFKRTSFCDGDFLGMHLVSK